MIADLSANQEKYLLKPQTLTRKNRYITGSIKRQIKSCLNLCEQSVKVSEDMLELETFFQAKIHK